MSDQWIHDFIDSRVLDDRFEVEEFDNFTAKINSCSVPIFQNMESPWYLKFEEGGTWKAIEYEDDYDPCGMCIQEGNLTLEHTSITNWYPDQLDEDEDAIDFIKSMFPDAIQISNRNVFKINGELVDFDYMEGIRFGFKN